MTTNRIPFDNPTRVAVRARDNDACRKCGVRKELKIHHITSVVDGGTNELDNLILLCGKCHSEWHMMHSLMPLIGWDRWLALPPAAMIVQWFVSLDDPELAGLPVGEVRTAMLQMFAYQKAAGGQ